MIHLSFLCVQFHYTISQYKNSREYSFYSYFTYYYQTFLYNNDFPEKNMLS